MCYTSDIMQVNQYGQHVYSGADDEDIADLLYSTGGEFEHLPVLDQPVQWPRELDLEPLPHVLNNQDKSIQHWDADNQKSWFMPVEYQTLDIVQLILDRCTCDAELQRAGQELIMYAERDLLDLLRYMHYFVETAHKHSIVLGVGRGSSVSSFVLFLLGVHKINSLYFDLDITEFLK